MEALFKSPYSKASVHFLPNFPIILNVGLEEILFTSLNGMLKKIKSSHQIYSRKYFFWKIFFNQALKISNILVNKSCLKHSSYLPNMTLKFLTIAKSKTNKKIDFFLSTLTCFCLSYRVKQLFT
jgi:hypothetical protein